MKKLENAGKKLKKKWKGSWKRSWKKKLFSEKFSCEKTGKMGCEKNIVNFPKMLFGKFTFFGNLGFKGFVEVGFRENTEKCARKLKIGKNPRKMNPFFGKRKGRFYAEQKSKREVREADAAAL